MGSEPRTLPKRHVERILLAVGPEILLVQPVRPGRQKRNATHVRSLLKLADIGRREIQNVLPVNFHLIGAIPDGGHNRDFDAFGCIGEANDRDTVVRCLLSGVVLSKGRGRQCE